MNVPREIEGLIVFNVDTMLQKQTEKVLKVNLMHISAVKLEKYEEIVDIAMQFIWKQMHCSVIRLTLYHYQQDGKL